ncbi:MAG: hypothetical protein OHK0012_17570 [Synechococcales cyanobacterium]
MKPTLRFQLDYCASPLWNKEGNIGNIQRLGVSPQTEQLANELTSYLYDHLNPVYQGFPSFWGEDLCQWFNGRVLVLYEQLCRELSDCFDLVFAETTFYPLHRDPDVDVLLRDPVGYCQEHGVNYGQDEAALIAEVEQAYQDYLVFAQQVLSEGKNP